MPARFLECGSGFREISKEEMVPFAEIDVIYLGIDCGTQGTKAVLFDPDCGRIIGRGYALLMQSFLTRRAVGNKRRSGGLKHSGPLCMRHCACLEGGLPMSPRSPFRGGSMVWS